MRDLSRSAGAQIADNQHWLERQRHLETELQLAQQARRSSKRKHAAALAVALAASAPALDDSSNDNWMMTYLDMMTLLLVVVMAMLAIASTGKPHDRSPAGPTSPLPQVDTRQLSQVDTRPPGALLLVAQPARPEPAKEPLAEPQQPEQPAPGEVIATRPETAEPPAPAQPSLDDLLKELPLDRLGDGIEVVKNESTVSFRISSEILFPSGQSDLNLKGLKVLHNLVPVLNSVPHKVIVAGHTDTQDIRSSRFPSNWELSSARAGTVVRYLQSNGVEGTRLSAVGYADTRPLADNGTAEGRATNRRVELMLQPL